MQIPLRHVTFGITVILSTLAATLGSGCGSDSGSATSATNVGGTGSVGGAGSAGGSVVGNPSGNAGTSAVAAGTTAGTCTSGVTWVPRQGASVLMRPGEACIACHATNPDAPAYEIAGTVFPTLHDPNDCNGAATTSTASITVVVTDANGVEQRIAVNAAGNFMLEGVTIAKPFHARVEVGTRQSTMIAAQTSGDCNSCHTAAGLNGAPGRIMAP